MATDAASPAWRYEGMHFKVGVLADSRVVVFERSALSTGDADLAAIFGPVEPALHGIPRERYGLLIDVRAARGRNDSDFEKRFEPYRQSIQRGFRRVAIVVATPQGKLQANRYAREDRLPNTVFDDYAAAIGWLEEATLR